MGDRVYSFLVAGRAWVMDVADDGRGNPVIVYAAGGFGIVPRTFRYARWDGARWLDHTITDAIVGPRATGEAGAFQTGGIVLDHADTATVYLSRILDARAVVERWRTPDGGISRQLHKTISPRGENCFRPASPVVGTRPVVAYVCGCDRHWTNYATTIHLAQL